MSPVKCVKHFPLSSGITESLVVKHIFSTSVLVVFSMWVKMETVYYFISLIKRGMRFWVQKFIHKTELKVTTYFAVPDTSIHISWQPKMPGV